MHANALKAGRGAVRMGVILSVAVFLAERRILGADLGHPQRYTLGPFPRLNCAMILDDVPRMKTRNSEDEKGKPIEKPSSFGGFPSPV